MNYKKIAAALCASLMLNICVSAADTVNIQTEGTNINIAFTDAEWAEKEISVLVYSTLDENGASITPVDINETNFKKLVVYADSVAVDADGKCEISYLMNEDDISSDYKVYFSLKDGSAEKTDEYYYASLVDRNRIIEEIKDVIDDGTELYSYFESNSETNDLVDYKIISSVGYLNKEYQSLDSEKRSSVCERAVTLNSGDALKAFNEAVIIELINAASESEIEGVLEKYQSVTNVDIKADENYQILKNSDKLDVLMAALAKAEFSSFEDLKNKAKECGAISVLNVETAYKNIYKLLSDNNDIFVLNFTDYLLLSDYYKTEVQKAMLNNGFTTVKQVQEKFKSAVANAKSNSNQSSNVTTPSYGGGGGGGVAVIGGGNVPAVTQPQPENTEDNQTQASSFVDLEGFSWAKNAIEELSAKNIISGVSEDRFEPERNITREEFVKLVVSAFGIGEIEGETDFSDVDDNEWYAKYIKTAVANGIVNGKTETSFGVGENITRQDMCVIIYRAKKDLEAGTANKFADDEDISEYAKDAIYAMKNAGIVSGMGDNTFMPNGFATRAQAATIIYNAIK